MNVVSNSENGKFNILLVEDDDDLRLALKFSLTSKKYNVTDCANGKEAIAILALNNFDLILSDIRMAFVHGIELLKHVRKTSNVPFVLMTGFSEIIDTKEAYRLGATSFITKPFESQELLATVQMCIRSKASDKFVTGENISGPFCSIHIDDFLGGKTLPVDLYIKMTEEQFVKIASKGSEILSEQVRAYKAKEIEYLYIKENDFPAYVNMIFNISEQGSEEEGASELKTKILKNTQDSISQEIFLSDFDREKFDKAAALVVLTLSVACEDRKILQLIQNIATHTDYLYIHSVAVSIYSVMLAQEMGWRSSLKLFKLALGGLLHDIGKREIERNILNKPMAQLDPQEIKILESHSFRGKEILSALSNLHGDVVAIAWQHHKSLYELDPAGGSEPHLHPSAKIVAVANRFCELTIKNPVHVLLAPTAALDRLQSLDKRILDEKTLAALASLVSGRAAPRVPETSF